MAATSARALSLLALLTLPGVALAQQPGEWPSVTLELVDGGQLTGELVGTADGVFYLRLADGRLLPVPFAEVAALHRGAELQESVPAPEPEPDPQPELEPGPRFIPVPYTEPTAEERPPAPPPERVFLESSQAPPGESARPAVTYEVPHERKATAIPVEPDPLELGFEVSFGVAMGARAALLLPNDAIHSLGLRVGLAEALVAWQTDLDGVRYQSRDGATAALYLLPTFNLGRQPITLELSTGLAFMPAYGGYWGLAHSVALRSVPLQGMLRAHLGVMVLSDRCWNEPMLVLDMGPELAW